MMMSISSWTGFGIVERRGGEDRSLPPLEPFLGWPPSEVQFSTLLNSIGSMEIINGLKITNNF